MHFIISLLVYAVIILLAAYITPGVQVKSFGTALWIAFLLAILNPTLGWMITFFFHVATFGLFWLMGLGFILRFFAFVIIIRISEGLSGGFRTQGCGNTIAFAIVLAVLGTLVYHLLAPGGPIYPNHVPDQFWI
jgi:putative membrane protein